MSFSFAMVRVSRTINQIPVRETRTGANQVSNTCKQTLLRFFPAIGLLQQLP